MAEIAFRSLTTPMWQVCLPQQFFLVYGHPFGAGPSLSSKRWYFAIHSRPARTLASSFIPKRSMDQTRLPVQARQGG